MAEEKQVQEAEAAEETSIDLGASLSRKQHKEKKPVNKGLIVIIALCVIIVGVAAGVVVPRLIPEKEEEVVDLTVTLVDRADSDLETITVEGENTFTLSRETRDSTTVYHVSGMDDAKVNSTTCAAVFYNTSTIKAVQLVEENPADLSLYGLDNPVSKVTIAYKDGSSFSFKLGARTAINNQIYCLNDADGNVYVLSEYLGNTLGGSMLRYQTLTLDTLDTDPANLKSIIIRRKGEDQIRFEPVKKDTTTSLSWKMTQPYEIWLDTTHIQEFAEYCDQCSLFSYEGSASDLADYGLDDPWFAFIISDVNGAKRDIRMGNEVETDDVTGYYCCIDDSNDVYIMSKNYTEFMETFNAASFITPFTGLVSILNVESMTLNVDGKTYEMAISKVKQYDEDGKLMVDSNNNPDYAYVYTINGKEVQEKAFKAVYTSVISVTISNIAKTSLVNESAAPEASVTFRFSDGSPETTIEYLPYDINNYCVRRDGLLATICKKDDVNAISTTMTAVLNGEYDEEE